MTYIILVGADRLKTPRIALIHIGKTGGTSVKASLRPHYSNEEVCKLQFEGQYPEDLSEVAGFRLYDSHIGTEIGRALGAEMITVIRSPLDRLLSLYHYWREVPDVTFGPGLAKRLSFEEFIDRALAEPFIKIDVVNCQTWQIAAGVTERSRSVCEGMSEDEVLARAIKNLDEFACVGVTEAMGLFFHDLSTTFGIKLEEARTNVTKNRPLASALSIDIRRRCQSLIELDLALYDHVLRNYVLGRSSHRPKVAG